MKKYLLLLVLLLIVTGCGSNAKKAVCKVRNSNSYLYADMIVEAFFNDSNTRVTRIEKTMNVEITDLEYIKGLCGRTELSECIDNLIESTKKGTCKNERYNSCEVKNKSNNGFVIYAIAEISKDDKEWDDIKLNQSKEEFINQMKKEKNVTCE